MNISKKKMGGFVIVFLGNLFYQGCCVQAVEVDEEHTEPRKVVRVLSLDGGGVRGIVSLSMLAELEKRLGKPISESFDVIAGTSTGGIIALSLTRPDPEKEGNPLYSASDLLTFYTKYGDRLFGKRNQNWFSFGGLTRPRYSAHGLEALSRMLLGQTALSGALSNVLVTSYDIGRDEPLLFESYKAQEDPDENYYMRDVAVGTSCAPTFFPPKMLKSFYGRPSCVVDGGVILNNPALSALAAAKELYPDAQDMVFVSIGTGKALHELAYEDMKEASALSWAKPMLSIGLTGAGESVDMHMRRLLPDVETPLGKKKQRYFRFQPTLPQKMTALDKVSSSHVQALLEVGRRHVEENKSALDALVCALRSSSASVPLVA